VSAAAAPSSAALGLRQPQALKHSRADPAAASSPFESLRDSKTDTDQDINNRLEPTQIL
jgi:hypothetical protein